VKASVEELVEAFVQMEAVEGSEVLAVEQAYAYVLSNQVPQGLLVVLLQTQLPHPALQGTFLLLLVVYRTWFHNQACTIALCRDSGRRTSSNHLLSALFLILLHLIVILDGQG
jgi:hypothetical protein